MPLLSLHSADLTLYYAVINSPDSKSLDPSKETLLLIHPGLTDSTYFDRLYKLPALGARFNLVVFDSPAHGQTYGEPATNGTLERKARCMVEAWTRLNYGPFHCLGEGLCGTTIAIYLYTLQPNLVKSLLLISPMHGYDCEATTSFYQRVVDQLLSCKTGKGGSKVFDQSSLRSLQNFYQGEQTCDEDRQLWLGKFIDRYGGKHTMDELIELFNPLLNRKPLPDAILEDVECPVLILAGSADQATSPERAFRLQESLSGVPVAGAQVHVVHNAPHWMSQAFPTIVYRFIQRFIEQQRASGQ